MWWESTLNALLQSCLWAIAWGAWHVHCREDRWKNKSDLLSVRRFVYYYEIVKNLAQCLLEMCRIMWSWKRSTQRKSPNRWKCTKISWNHFVFSKISDPLVYWFLLFTNICTNGNSIVQILSECPVFTQNPVSGPISATFLRYYICSFGIDIWCMQTADVFAMDNIHHYINMQIQISF